MNDNLKNEILFSIFERTIRRLWVLCIVLIIMLVATNICWVVYESQYETVETTQMIETDTDGAGSVNCIIGDKNEVSGHGTSENVEND